MYLSDARPVPAGVGCAGADNGSLIRPSLGVQPVLETSQLTGHERFVQTRPFHLWPIVVEAGAGKGMYIALSPRGLQLRDLPCLAWLSSRCSCLCWAMSPQAVLP